MFRLLRQPRYAALSVLMAVVALACIGAGSWQIARFEQKVHANDDLRANAHAARTSVPELLPLLGKGAAPSRNRVEFRPVRVTGVYDAGAQSLVRNWSVNDQNGFAVLTPLRTGNAVLLVARGFLAQPASGGVPSIPPPPSGAVTIAARVQPPEARHDKAAQLSGHQVESINPGDQAARLGTAIYNGYAQLDAHQPGTSGLIALPGPDLSNPAGGALEPQHFAYVIQWYLFAALAVAAPFAMARAELKQRRGGEARDFDEVAGEAGPPAAPRSAPVEPALTEEERRAAKLADRYGHAR